MKKIVLLGAGGHAKSMVDSIEQTGEYEVIGFVAPDEIGKKIYREYKIIGHDEDLHSIYDGGVHYAAIAVGFLGESRVRNRLEKTLRKYKYQMPAIVDKSAVIASDAQLGEGCFVGKHAVINSEAFIGDFCIINTSAIIEHECRIGTFSHVAVGAIVCGQAVIGENVFIGSNATIIQGIQVADEVMIGAGAVVLNDIKQKCTVVGVPAKKIHDR